MHLRVLGFIAAFALVSTVIALQPGSGQPVSAVVVDTETPTVTETTVATNTATSTVATSTPTATATGIPAPTNPVLGFPTSVCSGAFPFPTTANSTFTWTAPANVASIYVDISPFDNNFADGSYATQVLAPGTTSFTWTGLVPGFFYLARVTAQGLDGSWVMSDFVRFTPCGAQRLLDLQYTCTGGGRATVTFRWAPTSSPGLLQYLDLSLFNNNFASGTFLGAGPLLPSQQAVVWPGIIANVQHYYRVNTLTLFGWGPSLTGSFVAVCGS